MIRREFVVVLAVLGIAATSCKNDTEYVEPPIPKTISNFVVTNNAQELSSRIQRANTLIPIEDASTSTLKSAIKLPSVDISKNYAFTLCAEVPSPLVDGMQIQATHVSINYPYAIVSYNTQGSDYRGGIEVFNVSNTSHPTIVSQALFPNADINAVDYYNGKIYLVGAAEPAPLKLTSAAFLEVLNTNGSGQIVSADTIISIGSYAGTDIRVTAENICVSSGSGTDGNGGVKVFDHKYKLLYEKPMDHARSIQVKDGKLFAMQSEPARITSFEASGLSLVNTFSLQGATTPNSKSEIDVNEKYIYAALNEGGLRVINKNSGVLKQHIPRPATIPGGKDENFVTNSVSVYGDLVLTANGQAGISVGGIIPSKQDSIQTIGRFSFKDGESSNYVEQKDSIIFVATGIGGLKIIHMSIDDGLPENPIDTKPCPSLATEIYKIFPRGENNIEARPSFFASNAPQNVLVTKSTKVYVTFIDENSGYKNSFGYYAYPADNPPKSVSELKKYIVFPNVSKVKLGGTLKPGCTVQLGKSEFPPNTVIGFFITTKSWLGGCITDGLYTLYTNNEFNPFYFRQHTLFVEKGCSDLVLTFEEVLQHISNKDYNDIIMVISDDTNPATANSRIKMDGYPEWPL
ncbi:DUF4114 domain-containing protein [uncultured Acetobacteroides sp.]|uniref:DUF4114 domain-containing protein n=1 Tax=uncultured Acetobacteroides sp. TaxID=1760811 RepID=UPI0029F50F4D|nr:DUF4114 domain-containing protein [uncultured Acetobacteroides sp.]